eukprot:Lithocolla_globosa_v1_NODE_2201_length_2113_cov_10.709427.p1 type:complete len:567 gc:universal NODE_2201_length_2113_cov_10.709427:412-2112(+)
MSSPSDSLSASASPLSNPVDSLVGPTNKKKAGWTLRGLGKFDADGREVAVMKKSELTTRQKIFKTFDDPEYSRLSFFITNLVMGCILLSTITLILVTDESLVATEKQRNVFFGLEVFVIVIFTVEYVVRVCTCEIWYLYIFQPLNIIDFLAILPFYLEVILVYGVGVDTNVSFFAVLRIIRLIRVFRLFKAAKGLWQLRLFAAALKRSFEGIIMLLFLLLLADIFFSTCLFYAETTYCEIDEENLLYVYKGNISPLVVAGTPTAFQNVIVSLWWGVSTMTTVAYGDEVPVTLLGQMVGAVTMVVGLLVLAFPITIIGQHLSVVYDEHQRDQKEAKKRKDLEKGGIPRVEFTAVYDPEKNELSVNLLFGSNLPASDAEGTSDPYCKVTLLPDKTSQRTKVVPKNCNPVWDEEWKFEGITPQQLVLKTLMFEVFDYDMLSKDDLLGKANVAIKGQFTKVNEPTKRKVAKLVIKKKESEKTLEERNAEKELENIAINFADKTLDELLDTVISAQKEVLIAEKDIRAKERELVELKKDRKKKDQQFQAVLTGMMSLTKRRSGGELAFAED